MSDLKVNSIAGVGSGGFTGTVASEGGLATTDLQQGLCKAWAVYDMGDNAVDDSNNISTFTDQATGIGRLIFTNNYSSVSHADVGMIGNSAVDIYYEASVAKSTSTTGALAIHNTSDADTDGSPYCNVITTGDLA